MGVEMKTAMLGASAVKLHHRLLGSQTPDHSRSSAVQLPLSDQSDQSQSVSMTTIKLYN